MPRELDPSLLEKDFVLAVLRQQTRLDGRSPDALRKVEFNFSDAFGYVECRLGDTRVSAQVSAQVVKPAPERPYEGTLILSTEISPMASAVYEAGRSSDNEAIIGRLLEKALRQSNALDREALCIVAAQKVWAIRIDLHFMDDEGNLIDCACLAAVAALLHFRKPEVTVAGEDVTVHSMAERVPTALAMHHSPYCLTFAFFEDEELSVVDPNHLESQLQTGTLTLTLNAQSEICVLTKAGGAPMSVKDIMRCIKLASQRIKELDKLVRSAVQADLKLKLGNTSGGKGEDLT